MLRAGEEAERGLRSAADKDGGDQATAVAVTDDAAVHERALHRQRAALLHHGEDTARWQRGHRVAPDPPPPSTRLISAFGCGSGRIPKTIFIGSNFFVALTSASIWPFKVLL